MILCDVCISSHTRRLHNIVYPNGGTFAICGTHNLPYRQSPITPPQKTPTIAYCCDCMQILCIACYPEHGTVCTVPNRNGYLRVGHTTSLYCWGCHLPICPWCHPRHNGTGHQVTATGEEANTLQCIAGRAVYAFGIPLADTTEPARNVVARHN